MKVTLNGRPQDIADGTTVAAVVTTVTSAAAGVAVAVNDAVVPRGDWESVRLQDSDRVEVLTAVQGG